MGYPMQLTERGVVGLGANHILLYAISKEP